jgi:hypothetical protein
MLFAYIRALRHHLLQLPPSKPAAYFLVESWTNSIASDDSSYAPVWRRHFGHRQRQQVLAPTQPVVYTHGERRTERRRTVCEKVKNDWLTLGPDRDEFDNAAVQISIIINGYRQLSNRTMYWRPTRRTSYQCHSQYASHLRPCNRRDRTGWFIIRHLNAVRHIRIGQEVKKSMDPSNPFPIYFIYFKLRNCWCNQF